MIYKMWRIGKPLRSISIYVSRIIVAETISTSPFLLFLFFLDTPPSIIARCAILVVNLSSTKTTLASGMIFLN